jgi:hypothetical protein
LKPGKRLLSRRPRSPAGAYRFAPDPISEKKKIKSDRKVFLFFFFSFFLSHPLEDRATALASNDAVRSYAQFLSSV